MSNATRYTAAGKRAAAARRDAQLADRNRRWAALPVDEFLRDYFCTDTPRGSAEVLGAARDFHARLVAQHSA